MACGEPSAGVRFVVGEPENVDKLTKDQSPYLYYAQKLLFISKLFGVCPLRRLGPLSIKTVFHLPLIFYDILNTSQKNIY